MYRINDPFSIYYHDSSVPLEDYSRELTKHELLRLDYKPARLIKGCSSSKNVNKLLDLLLKKNKNEIKFLNLSNCMVDLEAVKKLKLFPNLKGLVVENSFNWIPSRYATSKEEQKYFELGEQIVKEISKLKLELLNLSNNDVTNYRLKKLEKMKSSLKILSLQSRDLRNEVPDLNFRKFKNLRELDLYGNVLTDEQIIQICTLSKLTYLDIRGCSEMTDRPRGHPLRWDIENLIYLQWRIKNLKNLEVLKIRLPNPDLFEHFQLLPSDKWESYIKENLPKLRILVVDIE